MAGYASCGGLWGDLVVYGVDVRRVAEVVGVLSRRNCRPWEADASLGLSVAVAARE